MFDVRPVSAMRLKSNNPATHLCIASVVLAACYLLFLPSGWLGVVLTCAALLLATIGIGTQTLGTALLLSGPATLGIIARSAGVSSLGSIVSILGGLLLLFGFKRKRT